MDKGRNPGNRKDYAIGKPGSKDNIDIFRYYRLARQHILYYAGHKNPTKTKNVGKCMVATASMVPVFLLFELLRSRQRLLFQRSCQRTCNECER